MKTSAKMMATLNKLLSEELTAISQYMVHSEMCAHWGYTKLHTAIEKQAIDEMKHAEWLIQRILYLGGSPTMDKLQPMHIGKSVEEMLTSDEQGEMDAIAEYNAAIEQARAEKDMATGDLFLKILQMEEGHYDWERQQRAQIAQMGLEGYLANQTA